MSTPSCSVTSLQFIVTVSSRARPNLRQSKPVVPTYSRWIRAARMQANKAERKNHETELGESIGRRCLRRRDGGGDRDPERGSGRLLRRPGLRCQGGALVGSPPLLPRAVC